MKDRNEKIIGADFIPDARARAIWHNFNMNMNMKKFLIFGLLVFGAIAAPIYSARAIIDTELYPFADICGDDIDMYCVDVDSLGNCMIDNIGNLGPDCGDAVFYWAGDRWGWRDRGMRDRWEHMPAAERHAYATEHWGDYAGRGAELHGETHMGGEDSAPRAVTGEYLGIRPDDAGEHSGGIERMGGEHFGGGEHGMERVHDFPEPHAQPHVMFHHGAGGHMGGRR